MSLQELINVFELCYEVKKRVLLNYLREEFGIESKPVLLTKATKSTPFPCYI